MNIDDLTIPVRWAAERFSRTLAVQILEPLRLLDRQASALLAPAKVALLRNRGFPASLTNRFALRRQHLDRPLSRDNLLRTRAFP